MCGIAGYIGETKNPSECLAKMAQAINHRGPDSNGIWTDFKQIGLAHTDYQYLTLVMLVINQCIPFQVIMC